MRRPEDPGFPLVPPGEPTRDFLLAQALDACIAAERRLPGSGQDVIARQPAWARVELARLLALARSLDAATSRATMSTEFRAEARSRLMHRIGGGRLTALQGKRGASARHWRRAAWVRRAVAGVFAAAVAVAATLTASASALPGEPLYRLKQVQEELRVRLATDERGRAQALMGQADARLDETARLLQLGRTGDASQTTLHYDQLLDRAIASYVVTIDEAPDNVPAWVNVDAGLDQDEHHLQAMLQSAPEQARADLRDALVTTERGRALFADRQPADRRDDGSEPGQSALAGTIPTMAIQNAPTSTLTPTPTQTSPGPVPSRAVPRVTTAASDSQDESTRPVEATTSEDPDDGFDQHANAAEVARPVLATIADRNDTHARVKAAVRRSDAVASGQRRAVASDVRASATSAAPKPSVAIRASAPARTMTAQVSGRQAAGVGRR